MMVSERDDRKPSESSIETVRRLQLVLGPLWPQHFEAIALAIDAAKADEAEACALECLRLENEFNRESRHEPELMRNAAGAAVCAREIRSRHTATKEPSDG